MPNGGEIDFRFSIASLYSASCLRLEQLESSQRVRWRWRPFSVRSNRRWITPRSPLWAANHCADGDCSHPIAPPATAIAPQARLSSLRVVPEFPSSTVVTISQTLVDLKGVCRCANWPLSGSSLWELGSLQARHPLWHPPGAMAGRNISTPPPPSASPIRRGAIVPAPNLTTVRHRAGAGGEIGGGDRVASAGDGAGAGSPPLANNHGDPQRRPPSSRKGSAPSAHPQARWPHGA
jgi:hypothetical protein